MVNLFRLNVQASGEVESMKTMDGMKVPVSFTNLLVMQSRRNVTTAWMVGLERLSRLFMRL